MAAESVMRRAIEAGAPDLALKAADKVTKSSRGALATEVARSFLPANALAAFERPAGDTAPQRLLAGDAAASLRVDGAGRASLLPMLWAAVLAT